MKLRRLGALMLGAAAMGCSAAGEPAERGLELHLRSRVGSETATRTVRWDPRRTAIVVCDMWDDHWCKGAAARVGELAVAMNRVLREARSRGVFILHSPSECADFYKDTPARKRAQAAPFAKTPVPLSKETRWGTGWCWPDKPREPDLPIDDSDMGCNCPAKCGIRRAWTREIAALEIDPERDAITDDGQETWNLLAERKIEHVVLLGVHLNMCVLGRPFAIRQLVLLGKDVALMRDMTDTMYDARMKPRVNHFAGTDLVVEHIEKYWCPSFVSTDLVGGSPFRFREDPRQ